MLNTRVIPCLLLRNGGLVKTIQFKDAKYVGDPINAVRIFNDKEVDELLFLDIGATPAGTGPAFELLEDIASEAFMPFGYGGGISHLDHVKRLFSIGIEKVVLNTAAAKNPRLVEQAATIVGSSGVVVSVDVRRDSNSRTAVFTNGGKDDLKKSPVEYARELETMGAGEIVLTSIDRDGTQSGYDLDLIREVAGAVSIPVVASGGAGTLEHFREAVASGASAVAAGSMFIFHGKHRAVLIRYPEYARLVSLFGTPA